SRFINAVMRSAARLTYTQAMELIESPKPRGQHARMRPELLRLKEVYQAFLRARAKRGAIDFDLPQTKIELDEQGKVRSVNPVARLDTHRIIEECMIAANVEAAKRIRKARIPGLYRVHAGPDADRLEE